MEVGWVRLVVAVAVLARATHTASLQIKPKDDAPSIGIPAASEFINRDVRTPPTISPLTNESLNRPPPRQAHAYEGGSGGQAKPLQAGPSTESPPDQDTIDKIFKLVYVLFALVGLIALVLILCLVYQILGCFFNVLECLCCCCCCVKKAAS